MSAESLFDKLHSTGKFPDISLHFASFLAGLCGASAEVVLAAAFVSRAASQGHICVDLDDLPPPGDPLPELPGSACRNPGEWGEILLQSGAAAGPGGYAPLVLEKPSRLYLFRYWRYEKDLAERLLDRASMDFSPEEPDIYAEALAGLERGSSSEPDWQTVAVCTALLKKLCIISGGPGTGKTTVVGTIISAALSAHSGDPPRIALAAPTGKAAARLQEAVGSRLASQAAQTTGRVPEASTIHRLLGTVRGSPYFRHDAGNKLPFDMVVVDEGSMVDLALMAKLVQAVPDRARLIILGDRDQLSSVEAGAVLGDLCGIEDMNRFSAPFIEASARLGCLPAGGASPVHRESASPLLDCVVELRESYRFGKSGGIGKVSRAVKLGNGPEALSLLESGAFSDAAWRNLPAPEQLPAALASVIIRFYGEVGTEGNPERALARFDRFRVLCALREGPYGVAALNRLIERILSREGLIRPDQKWYRSRPILITSNDYNLNLFNGDLGIILPDPSAGGRHRAFFRSADGTVRAIPPAGLPDHETVYAMTVHKSQGAEFEEALMVLPDRASPVVTRELLYTGLTRARSRIEIWGGAEVFIEGVDSRTRRASGLRHRLWGR